MELNLVIIIVIIHIYNILNILNIIYNKYIIMLAFLGKMNINLKQ